MIVLGIETSCDETAVAVVGDDAARSEDPRQSDPLAARRARALWRGRAGNRGAGASRPYRRPWSRARSPRPASRSAEIDGIAAAAGPGLIGGLIVGSMAAKGLAWAAGKPFIAVNHLEAHALAARLTDGVEFPYLLLLVSGGHCQLLVCAGVGPLPPSGRAATTPPARPSTRPAKLHRARLSRRAGDRARRAWRRSPPLRPAAPAQGQARLRFLVLRAEDGGASDRRRARPPRAAATRPILPPRSSWRSATR